MKRFLRFYCLLFLLALLLTGCSRLSPLEEAPPSSTAPDTVSQEAWPSPPETTPQAFYSPEQQAVLLQRLEGSVLLTVSPQGEALARREFPGAAYDAAQYTPDGNALHLSAFISAGGESFYSQYAVLRLSDDTLFPAPSDQGGIATHRLLGDNLIGFAYGYPDQWGGCWVPLELYDLQYQPLPVPAFDFGASIEWQGITYRERSLTGIGYDASRRLILLGYAQGGAWQEERAPDPWWEPHYSARAGVAAFDRDTGELAWDLLLPETYAAPFSSNMRMLNPNAPLVLPDGRFLFPASREGEDPRDYWLLLVDPTTGTVLEFPHCGWKFQLDETGDSFTAWPQVHPTGETCPPIRYDLSADRRVAGPPAPIPAPSSVWEGEQEWRLRVLSSDDPRWLIGRTQARCQVTWRNYINQCYLFYWDGRVVHKLLPMGENDWAPYFVGTDPDGNCQLLLPGVAEIWRQEEADEYKRMFPDADLDRFLE